MKKVGDWTDLCLKFEVLDEKTEWQISQFHFEGPHDVANMEAHAHNFLLAFVEFLESVYVCCGWLAVARDLNLESQHESQGGGQKTDCSGGGVLQK